MRWRRPATTRSSRPGPVRTCIGCRTRRAAADLVRVWSPDRVVLATGKGPGRGAWLCPDVACLDRAAARGAFSRALEFEVRPDEVARLRYSWSSEPPELGPERS